MLRPLNDKGQPKSEKELSESERRIQKVEREMDEAAVRSRQRREAFVDPRGSDRK
ncbi:MAG TPA: hypothetical protein VF161_12885 [Steroidobacteraceae bacterium]